MVEKVVIIGSGPAGWSAAIYTARATLNPLVFEGADTNENATAGLLPLGQLNLTTEVENYAGFAAGNLKQFLDTAIAPEKRQYMTKHSGHGVSGPELMELMRQQAANFGTRIVTDDIVAVDFSKRPFRVKPREGDWIEAHSVIVATGARANYLGLPSEERFKNRGVSGCAVCDGALPRFRNRDLVVVGGGDSAMEEANYLTKYASKVHIVHRRDTFRASKVMADRALNNPKISPVWNSAVLEVLGDDEKGVTGVRVQNLVDKSERVLEVGGMFLGIGHTPNTTFLQGQLELKPNGFIKWTVPFRTNTSVEGVFAAGDVADDTYKQ
ncbi:MAG TPA: FAD-dependent oxidoreductase, partial [Pirellulales bacterium]